MAKILFEHKGLNYKVPGLPYENKFEYVRPIVLDSVPTMDELEKLILNSDVTTLVNPWTIDVLRGFRDYIPTTFMRVAQNMNPDAMQQYFGSDENYIPEKERVLLQLQTEIEAKAATIDAAIIHKRKELGTVVNKAHIANRLYVIGRFYGHLKEREYPFLFGNLLDPTTWDDALSQIKRQFIEYMLEIPVGKRNYERRVRKIDVPKKDIQKRFVYVEWLKQKLGDDLAGVLLYGSAARTDNPEGYSDFDNWVMVRDIARAHQILKNTCPAVYDGKVIEAHNDSELPHVAKHLGIHLFPANEEYVIRHIRFLHDPREFLMHTKVLFGEFPFLKVGQDEVIERGISQAYMKLKTIAGSLNWAYFAPESILGKPSLFEFIVKNVRFFIQHSLNATEGPHFRDKDELNRRLKERDLHIPEYKEDIDYIKKSLLYATVSVLQLQKEFVDSGRKPNLDFLVDNHFYEWNDPKVDNWESAAADD